MGGREDNPGVFWADTLRDLTRTECEDLHGCQVESVSLDGEVLIRTWRGRLVVVGRRGRRPPLRVVPGV